MDTILPDYTRVSAILSIFQAYSFVERKKLKEAQDTGTAVHSAIEQYFCNRFEPVHPKLLGYMESFLSWAYYIHPQPLLIEKRLYDPNLMITGQLDLVANVGGTMHLIDFKTGSWAHPEIWELQLTFYQHLFQVNHLSHKPEIMGGFMGSPEIMMVVQLQKDGSAAKIYSYKYDEKNFQICLHAFECWKFLTNAVASNSPLI